VHLGTLAGMSKDDWRRRADAYPLAGALSPRFADMDRWQHLNNAALIGLHGEVALQALARLLGPDLWRPGPARLLLRASQTDFLAESHYPAPLATGARLLGLDAQGLHLATALFQQGRCVGLQRAVWAPSGAEPQDTPWPPAWADALADALATSQATSQASALAAKPAPPDASNEAPALLLPPAPAVVPTLAQMDWQTTLPLRFADTDACGLVADATLARLAEQLRVGLVARLGAALVAGGNTGFMVAQVALRWLQRGPAPEAFTAGSRVTRVGERSIGLQGALFDARGACVAMADSVLVCIDRASRRSTALPPALRQALAAAQTPAQTPVQTPA